MISVSHIQQQKKTDTSTNLFISSHRPELKLAMEKNEAISAKFGKAMFINKAECGFATKSKCRRRDAVTLR
jgi:hypothetical protein